MKQILLATTALALSSAAFAADLSPPTMPLKAPPMVAAPAFTWTGCYVGGQLGGDWGHANFIDPNTTFGGGFGLFAPTGSGVGINQGGGVLGGGQLGCDYQFATNWVVGLAGDFSWTNINGSSTDPYAFADDSLFGGKSGVPATMYDKTEWLATATGRVGYAWDRFMLYGKGGAAWEHSRDSIQNLAVWGNPAGFCYSGGYIACNPSGTETNAGWTVGVGLAWAFADNWSAGIEYDHYGFGNHTVTLSDFLPGYVLSSPITVNQRIDAVKLTLDYRFTWLAMH